MTSGTRAARVECASTARAESGAPDALAAPAARAERCVTPGCASSRASRVNHAHCHIRYAYFFSSSLPPSVAPCAGAAGDGAPVGAAGLNGKLLNMFFAWFCICSCICTNMFFDCSM